MVPELVVLALEYHRAPLRYRHLADPRRPLPRQFSRLIGELGSALSPQHREATARFLGVPPDALEQAAGFFLRDVLLTPGADHYRVLGLTRHSSQEDIRQHYQLLVGVFHPDRSTGDRERDAASTARLNDAYHTLRNPEKRVRYDQQTRQDGLDGVPEFDDRDFFRPLAPIEPFPGAGAVPRPNRSAQRLVTISVFVVLAAGLTVFLLVRPSQQPTLRASADLRNQAAPRPSYLAQPEAAAPLAGRSSQTSQAPIDAPAAANAAPAQPAAPAAVPRNPAESGSGIAESRDAIRSAVLEGREDLLAQVEAAPRGPDVAEAGPAGTARRPEGSPRQAGLEAPTGSLVETDQGSAGSGRPLDVIASRSAPALAGSVPPAETPARMAGGGSREAAGETAAATGQQMDAAGPAPSVTGKPAEPVPDNDDDQVAAAERIPAAPAADKPAVPKAEPTPRRREEPAKDSKVAAAGQPETPAAQPEPHAKREIDPAKDRKVAAAVAPKEPAAPKPEPTNERQIKPTGDSKAAAAVAPAVAAESRPQPKRQAEPPKDNTVVAQGAREEPAAAKPKPAVPPPKRQPEPPADNRIAAIGAPAAPPPEPRPTGSPPLSPADVVDRLMQTYRSGDLDGFMRLFAANAQINGGGGTRHIRSRYADMFARLPERRLTVQNLSWRKGPDNRVIGKGVIQLSARSGPRSDWGHASGSITLELVSAVGGYRIAKMIHRLD